MNIGEKAKAYDEAIKVGRDILKDTTNEVAICNNVKGCVTCVDRDQWAHIEQNPAGWSEEERKIIETLIHLVRDYNWQRITCGFVGADKEEVLSWLKFLRPHWKPSEEQMNALEEAVSKFEGYADYDDIKSLYNDLKKLTEE